LVDANYFYSLNALKANPRMKCLSTKPIKIITGIMIMYLDETNALFSTGRKERSKNIQLKVKKLKRRKKSEEKMVEL
jgi:hypothetical protein